MTTPPLATYLATPRERDWMTADYILAGRPPESLTSGGTMQHFFAEPGERSICDEVSWVEVIRWSLLGKHIPQLPDSGKPKLADVPPFVPDRAWLCTRCQAVAVATLVTQAICPACRAPLTDPSRSPEGWAHCRVCRRGWLVVERDGEVGPVGRDWPTREAVA